MAPTRIVFDPFFDGDARDSRVAAPGGVYGDPRDELLTSVKSTLAGQMPPGPRGLTAVVVPRATEGGAPTGIMPNEMQNTQINIDPHISGQSVSLTLGQLTPELMAQGRDFASRVVPTVNSRETRRLSAAAVFHGAAAGLPQPPPAEAPQLSEDEAAPLAQQARAPQVHRGARLPHTAVVPAPRLASHGTPVARQVRPLAALNRNLPPGGQPLAVMNTARATPAEAGVAEPAIEVTVEIANMGRHTVFFHDVLVQDGFIVVVYDTRHRGSRYHFPASSENLPPMAMQVGGDSMVYEIQPTGVTFDHNYLNYTVLLVGSAGELGNGNG